MNVQSINNSSNSMNFEAASVKFANPKNGGSMYSARAKELINKLKEMPDAEITVAYVKGKSQEDSFLTAKNSKTGVVMKERVAKGDYSEEHNGLSKKSIGLSDTFSNLLEAILNPHYLIHNDFWYGEEQFKPDFKPYEPKIFVA